MVTSDEPIVYEEYDTSYESALWKGFLVVLTLIFVLSVYNCGKEIYYYVAGECTVAELYNTGGYTAKAAWGSQSVQVSISQIYNMVEDDKVNVYFINDNLWTAMPMTKPWIWVLDFGVMALLYVLFGYKLYNIHREKKLR